MLDGLLKPSVAWFTTGGTRREIDPHHLPGVNTLCPVKLHGFDAVAHLEGQPRIGVEADGVGDLSQNSQKLPHRHVRAIVFVHVPQLDEGLVPAFGVGPAIEATKRTGLHFGDMIAGTNVALVIVEDEGLVPVPCQRVQQRLCGNLGGMEHRPHQRSRLGNLVHG